MELESINSGPTAKLPILKLGEYEMWVIRIKQYFQILEYALWENRVLVVKPHNKTPYELFRGFKPALSFMRPFGCHVTTLNTLDSLGKFDGKGKQRKEGSKEIAKSIRKKIIGRKRAGKEQEKSNIKNPQRNKEWRKTKSQMKLKKLVKMMKIEVLKRYSSMIRGSTRNRTEKLGGSLGKIVKTTAKAYGKAAKRSMKGLNASSEYDEDF
ncbi:hypothetical protein Tco_1053741 [Tanacetum coccineum]|uniref:Uncharacterized protein n=1 Tax=Tanacetum coccineum TaxID=301880 RepID=A0ABQ5GVQ1_9ASTR